MDYCVPVYSSPSSGAVQTLFFCDWNSQFYDSASQCIQECSQLMISKSDASFIVLLIVSLFVLFLISWIAKAILE
jgi:hypothetical protein